MGEMAEQEMDIFKKNKLVILTRGRMTSAKAIILGKLEDGRLLVSGYIRRKNNAKKVLNPKSGKARMFIKKMNPMHLLATSHAIDFDFKLPTGEAEIEKIFTDAKYKREVLDKIESALDNKKSHSHSSVW